MKNLFFGGFRVFSFLWNLFLRRYAKAAQASALHEKYRFSISAPKKHNPRHTDNKGILTAELLVHRSSNSSINSNKLTVLLGYLPIPNCFLEGTDLQRSALRGLPLVVPWCETTGFDSTCRTTSPTPIIVTVMRRRPTGSFVVQLTLWRIVIGLNRKT